MQAVGPTRRSAALGECGMAAEQPGHVAWGASPRRRCPSRLRPEGAREAVTRSQRRRMPKPKSKSGSGPVSVSKSPSPPHCRTAGAAKGARPTEMGDAESIPLLKDVMGQVSLISRSIPAPSPPRMCYQLLIRPPSAALAACGTFRLEPFFQLRMALMAANTRNGFVLSRKAHQASDGQR